MIENVCANVSNYHWDVCIYVLVCYNYVGRWNSNCKRRGGN